jgi:hypothetical protein
MKEQDQHDAILAFWAAMLLQLFGLIFPTDARPVLLWWWLQDLRGMFSGKITIVDLFELFYIGANLLWLVSPFVTRVYGQSPAVRMLAMVLSIAATAATCFWFYKAITREPCLYAILAAAIVHTIGMFLIRKEGPETEGEL